MTKPARPQHDPAALSTAVETVQAAARRLLAAGAAPEDVSGLVTAVRTYLAEHAAAKITDAGMTAASPIYKGAVATVGTIRTAPFPRLPEPPSNRARPLPLATPCARDECGHPLSWHVDEHGCTARGGACSCPEFRSPAAPDCAECGHSKDEHRNGACFLCGYLFVAQARHEYTEPQED